MTYRTVQNDMLDQLCWRFYQRSDVIVQVLEANPGLCELPEKLPAGVLIELPDIKPPGDETVNVLD